MKLLKCQIYHFLFKILLKIIKNGWYRYCLLMHYLFWFWVNKVNISLKLRYKKWPDFFLNCHIPFSLYFNLCSFYIPFSALITTTFLFTGTNLKYDLHSREHWKFIRRQFKPNEVTLWPPCSVLIGLCSHPTSLFIR